MAPPRLFLVQSSAASVWSAGLAPAGSMNAAPTPGGDAQSLRFLALRVDAQRQGTGAAMAVLRGDAVAVLAHGKVSLTSPEPPSRDSVFQIASLTKIFTALLLADAVQRGEVGLDDRIDLHLPVTAPTFGGRPITLRDLAAHTSGLPSSPASRVDRGQDDPYDGYSEADLHADLEAVRLTRMPGSMTESSNFGYGLLGDALSRRAGLSFAELLQRRILDPLDLHDTALAPSPAMNRRLIQGYDADFAPARPWRFGALAPAGGLFSTLGDLTRFLQVFLGRGPRALVEASRTLSSLHGPAYDADTHRALGWREARNGGSVVFWSHGAGGGVRSFMAFRPDRGEGVIAFINRTSGLGVDDIAYHALVPSQPILG